MLIRRQVLEGIQAGRITLAFRRWKRPTVRAGGTLHTAIGVLAIGAVDRIPEAAVTERDARRAGYASRSVLWSELPADGTLYRITLRLAGPDPRVALRRRRSMSRDEMARLSARLARLDAASRRGAWTRTVLGLIARRPGARAADLAASTGVELKSFKGNVRKLKALGLTESLLVGYRLSARGRVLLRTMARRRTTATTSGS
jgi:hypothetical protein